MSDQLTTPMGNLTIRPAVAADAARLRELRLESLAAYPEAFAADYVMASAETAGFWTRRINNYAEQKSGVIFIAAVREQLVGMTGLVRGHWPKTRHSGTIWGVYVNHDWQGLGVAETLINGCLDWAREHELTVVKLGVAAGNMAAIRCYGRCGFTVYGVEPQAICVDGTYIDELLMVKVVG